MKTPTPTPTESIETELPKATPRRIERVRLTLADRPAQPGDRFRSQGGHLLTVTDPANPKPHTVHLKNYVAGGRTKKNPNAPPPGPRVKVYNATTRQEMMDVTPDSLQYVSRQDCGELTKDFLSAQKKLGGGQTATPPLPLPSPYPYPSSKSSASSRSRNARLPSTNSTSCLPLGYWREGRSHIS
jgi:hypothetical protein